MTSLVPKSLTPTSSLDALAEMLSRMSTNVNPEMIIQAFNAIQDKQVATRVALIAMSAAVSVRKVISDIASAINLNLGGKWMIDGKINFTMFAMLGHMIFLIPEIYHGKYLSSMVPTYVASLGGKANILEFGESGVLEGRSERQEILRNWAKRMKDFRAYELIPILDSKTIGIVKGTGLVASFLTFLYSWTIDLLVRLLLIPIYAVGYTMIFVWKYKFRLIFLISITSLVTSPERVLYVLNVIFSAILVACASVDFMAQLVVSALITVASYFFSLPDRVSTGYFELASVISLNNIFYSFKLFSIEASIGSYIKTEKPEFYSNFSAIKEFDRRKAARLTSELITNYVEIVVLDNRLKDICDEAERLEFLPEMLRNSATGTLELWADSAIYLSDVLKEFSEAHDEEQAEGSAEAKSDEVGKEKEPASEEEKAEEVTPDALAEDVSHIESEESDPDMEELVQEVRKEEPEFAVTDVIQEPVLREEDISKDEL